MTQNYPPNNLVRRLREANPDDPISFAAGLAELGYSLEISEPFIGLYGGDYIDKRRTVYKQIAAIFKEAGPSRFEKVSAGIAEPKETIDRGQAIVYTSERAKAGIPWKEIEAYIKKTFAVDDQTWRDCRNTFDLDYVEVVRAIPVTKPGFDGKRHELIGSRGGYSPDEILNLFIGRENKLIRKNVISGLPESTDATLHDSENPALTPWNGAWRVLGEPDEIQAKIKSRFWYSKDGEPSSRVTLTLQEIRGSMSFLARQNEVNPPLEFIENCRRDPRLDKAGIQPANFLSWLFGAASDHYGQFVQASLWQAPIIKMKYPEQLVRHYPVLLGPSEIGKSAFVYSMLPAILSRDYWTDGPMLTEQNTQKYFYSIKGKVLAELGEMKGLRQADSELIKQRTAQPAISIDLKYEHESTHRIHVCFIGTANPQRTFLPHDSTARDRFMTLELSGFQREQVEADLKDLGITLDLTERPVESVLELCREHLWACARDTLKELPGVRSNLGYLPPSIRGLLEERNSPWAVPLHGETEEKIVDWWTKKKELRVEGITDFPEGFSFAEIRESAGLDSTRSNDVSAVLHRLGFRRKQVGKNRVNRWVPPNESEG